MTDQNLDVETAKLEKAPKTTSPKPIGLTLLGWAAAVVILWGVQEAKSFLIPIIVSCLLALLMMPVVRLLKRYRAPEWLAVSVASLVLVLPLIGVASLVVSESQSLLSDWPHLSAAAKTEFNSFLNSAWAHRFHFNVQSLGAKVEDKASEGVTLVIASLAALFEAGSKMILVLFFAIMMLAARLHLRQNFERLIAFSSGPGQVGLLDATTDVLEKFLVARLLMILFVTIADFIILEAFQIPYAVSIAVFLGLMTLIPAVGFVLGLVPPLVIALAQGRSALQVIGLLAALWLVSSLQDHVLTPKLIGRRLNLNFLITYLAIFAGERLWGIWGMFLSIPILGVARILLCASPRLEPWGRLIQERDASEQEREKPPQPREPDQRKNLKEAFES